MSPATAYSIRMNYIDVRTGAYATPHPLFDTIGEQLLAEVRKQDAPPASAAVIAVLDVAGHSICGFVPKDWDGSRDTYATHLKLTTNRMRLP